MHNRSMMLIEAPVLSLSILFGCLQSHWWKSSMVRLRLLLGIATQVHVINANLLVTAQLHHAQLGMTSEIDAANSLIRSIAV